MHPKAKPYLYAAIAAGSAWFLASSFFQVPSNAIDRPSAPVGPSAQWNVDIPEAHARFRLPDGWKVEGRSSSKMLVVTQYAHYEGDAEIYYPAR